jgi:hypothetical protein
MSDPRILTPEQLAAIQGRCDKATPGPWEALHRNCYKTVNDDESCGLGLDVNGPPEPDNRGMFSRGADAVFIAASRTDIPALLGSHAALTEQLAAKDRLIHEYQDKDVQE